MTEFGFAAVPAITVLCLFLAQAYKSLVKNEELYKHIPVLCGVLGAILGALCYNLWPGYIPAENGLVAVVVGIVSGCSSTWLHQVLKQYTNSKSE